VVDEPQCNTHNDITFTGPSKPNTQELIDDGQPDVPADGTSQRSVCASIKTLSGDGVPNVTVKFNLPPDKSGKFLNLGATARYTWVSDYQVKASTASLGRTASVYFVDTNASGEDLIVSATAPDANPAQTNIHFTSTNQTKVTLQQGDNNKPANGQALNSVAAAVEVNGSSVAAGTKVQFNLKSPNDPNDTTHAFFNDDTASGKEAQQKYYLVGPTGYAIAYFCDTQLTRQEFQELLSTNPPAELSRHFAFQPIGSSIFTAGISSRCPLNSTGKSSLKVNC
jgi:hypothetical protein